MHAAPSRAGIGESCVRAWSKAEPLWENEAAEKLGSNLGEQGLAILAGSRPGHVHFLLCLGGETTGASLGNFEAARGP